MGSNNSKNDTVPVQKNDVDITSDPRSPTPEIIRTPLQSKTGSKHNITKNADLRKTLETQNNDDKLIHNNPILSAVIKNHLQSYDPRSPSQEFDRTPVIIASKLTREVRLGKIVDSSGSPNLQNDSIDNNNEDLSFKVSPDIIIPKNLCTDFYDLSLDDSLKDTEKPLGSSTASNEAIENDISNDSCSPKKLLQTNFDYVDNKDETFGICTPNVCEQGGNVDKLKNIPIFKILDTDPRSPSIGIDRTPIIVSKEENNTENKVEEMSDDSLIKVLQDTFVKSIHVDKIAEGEINIFKDDNAAPSNTTPLKSKSDSGSRTPLSCMKNKTDSSHGRSKSISTLYDPNSRKTSSRIPRRASHIPRLKSLSKPKYTLNASSLSLKISKTAAMNGGDCENTPPHSHRDHWDKDNSIVL
ncbi:uncharacterized protein LOC126966328 [Leptidea sinapis]|uniref:uncharacterized protein LOC126966328 n=1 Tax=Leptidea sinapis TaxID=189913 RepID=UPI002133D4EF|nr:uncharacterized protein LOC126966328 [Leptidea sinapis]